MNISDLQKIDISKLTESQRTQVRRMQEELHIVLKKLEEPDVFCVNYNTDGKLWATGAIKKECFGILDPNAALKAMNTIAYFEKINIHEMRPFLEVEIPIYGHRFSGAIPPATKAPTFSIRKKASKIWTLDEFVEQGILSKSHRITLGEAVERKENILICGGPGSGKTTFGNAILHEISIKDPDARVTILQDVDELQSSSVDVDKLFIPFYASKEAPVFTMDSILSKAMRRDAGRIWVGEIRGPEAYTLLSAWNMGHPGGGATIHANDARSALNKLEQYIRTAGITPNPVLIAEAVDYIVSIQQITIEDKDGNKYKSRKVEQLLEVQTYDLGEYRTLKM